MKLHYPQILRFLVIGRADTGIQFLLLSLLIEFDATTEILASALAYVLAAIFNYLANYHLTFASNQAHRDTLPKFIITATLGLGINTLIFAIVFYLTAYYLVAQIFATGCTLIINFLLHKFWIYRNPT
jgi:putative flippase GtrA